MQDSKYCYPNSNVLKNKLNIINEIDLFNAEKELTAIRLYELQENPIKGKFDFAHLKKIHQYIFQDIYEWAGKERTVEIGKGNLFCTVACLQDYAITVFSKYFSECFAAKDNFQEFISVFAENYGDLNALHPFREGNGRTQREFARLICLECGYDFDLSCTTHEKMLEASILSFNYGNNANFIKIFSEAIKPLSTDRNLSNNLKILTANDMSISPSSQTNDYYGYSEYKELSLYNDIYNARINKMNAEKNLKDIIRKVNNHNKYLTFEEATANAIVRSKQNKLKHTVVNIDKCDYR